MCCPALGIVARPLPDDLINERRRASLRACSFRPWAGAGPVGSFNLMWETSVPVSEKEREPKRPELFPNSFSITASRWATSSHEAPSADFGCTAALVPAHSR